MENRIRSRLIAASRQELRTFGLSAGISVAIMFGLVFPWLGSRRLPAWPWETGAVVVAVALAAPRLLHYIHFVWVRVVRGIGAVLTPIGAGAIYFLVITPVGWIRRRVAGDTLRRGLDAEARTYRVPSPSSAPGSMEKPY